ncbi:hypothetical protein [Chryseolinea lacunae]|uniref:Uncharacterized protein n=1 Tax=Chryseolinea lacunae TaxID=2801331 RepID=A0ABS1KQ51_9BACT|nr:hypothetical protein [Chryseolinea lacunae]MBL0741571.1 hypothetical protein [Chryseolinea lacunae]
MAAKKKNPKPSTTVNQLTKNGIREINSLFEYASPDDLRNTLIEIYHTYIIQQHHAFPINFDVMSSQMYFLMETLKNLKKK